MRAATWLGLVLGGAFGWLALQAFPAFGENHPRLALVLTVLALGCLALGIVGLARDGFIALFRPRDRLASHFQQLARRLDRLMAKHPQNPGWIDPYNHRLRSPLVRAVRDAERAGYKLDPMLVMFGASNGAPNEGTLRALPMYLNRLAREIRKTT